MRTNLFFYFIVLLSMPSFSQISFEKGYFIDNSDQKTECFIRNIDWKNNPTQFDYRMSEASENKTQTINEVKEFGIQNVSKYIRAEVNIERSSNANSTNYLNENKEPVFQKEVLFLKVLIEGKGNLYYYSEGELSKYFYNTDDNPIEQLIFIKYKNLANEILANQYYKQQLWLNLTCEGIPMEVVNQTDFNRKDLTNFFIKYNECHQSDFVNYYSKQEKDFFNLILKPRINLSSLKITNQVAPHRDTDYGTELGFGFGVELEFVLPFNKNKWSLFIDPSYSTIQYENVSDNRFIPYLPDGKVYSEVDLKSLEIPIGLRHYFFISETSRVFINVAFTFNSYLNSTAEFDAVDNSYHLNTLDTNSSTSLSYGIGYSYNKKIHLEIRQATSKEFLGTYASWQSDYQSLFSVIFGYSLF